ncbi:MAG: hypothetical protein K2Q10_11710, partial [Rhodospirillales bacterium]|nr:hypothetical protein [Rhodospirillales bacterium]
GLMLTERHDHRHEHEPLVHEHRHTHALIYVIVMMSSQESERDLLAALEAGADEFVGKSHDMTIFKARLKALLRRKYYVEKLLGQASGKGWRP